MMPRFLGEHAQIAQRETTSMQDLVDRFSISGSLDLRTATPEERMVLMQYLRGNSDTMHPSLLEEFLEAAVTYHDITLEEVEEYLRGLPAEQCYVFAVFILQLQPYLTLGDLFLFCYYKLSSKDQSELQEFARGLGGDASLLVVPDKNTIKEFLNQTHSFARVQEYLGYLVRSAERFEDPRVSEVLQLFVHEAHSLFLCIVPYITSLKRLGITIDVPDSLSPEIFFNHFNKEIALGRNRLIPVMQRAEEEQVSDYLLETRHAWSKSIPESLVRSFITIPSYARNLESTHPTSQTVVDFLGDFAAEHSVDDIFAHPESVARLMQYEKEYLVTSQISIAKYLEDLILREFGKDSNLSNFILHLEKYEVMFGVSFHDRLPELYERNSLSFGSRLDLVQQLGFERKENWLIRCGNWVRPEFFHLVVDSYAGLEKHKPFPVVEKELLVQCAFVFASITPDVLARLSSAEILLGIEHAAKFSCSSDVMQMIVERLGFTTICSHLEKRGISVSCVFVKSLLPFVSDKEFGAYVHTYSHFRPELLRALSPERILRLPLTDCIEYYQVLLRHRDFVSLRTLYEQTVVVGSRTHEHRDFIWSLILRQIGTDRELFVTMVSGTSPDIALQYHDVHYRDFLGIAEEKLIVFVQEKPTLLFDPSIAALVDDLSSELKEEFIALQQHFAIIADVQNFSKQAQSIEDRATVESFIASCTNEGNSVLSRVIQKTAPALLVGRDSFTSTDIALLSAARYAMETPLYQQFVDMGGEIPDSHLTKGWLSQFEHLVLHDDFGESRLPPFTFEQFNAEVSRRMQNIAFKELGLRGSISKNLEDQDSMLKYATYAHTHAKINPQLSHAIVKYAPHVFSEHFETWKSFGVLQELVGASSAMLQKGFEGMKRKKLLPANLSFEQYEQWVNTITDSEEDFHQYTINGLREAVEQVIRNAVYNEQIPAYLYEGGSVVENRYRELRDELLRLKKEERGYMKEYSHEKNMPFVVHRKWEDVKRLLKSFRNHKQGLLRQYTVGYYLTRLSHITADEVKREILKIPGAEIALSDVFASLKAYVGEKGLPAIEQIHTFVREVHVQMQTRGMLSRKVLSVTDAVDVSTLILSGRRPCSTCQDVEDVLSTGLLSLVVDPHVRLLQVYAGGELVGRAVMRLLHTTQGDPAIFVERVYKSLPSKHVDDLIYGVAIQKGIAMRVPVYGEDEGTPQRNSKGRIQSHKNIVLYNMASRSPMNFSDAASGRCLESGEFRIRHIGCDVSVHS